MTHHPFMPVIPVVDLLGGVAVQAVRGQRERYQPVRSILAPGADLFGLAAALQAQTASQALYLADLDAILSGQGNWDTLGRLSRELPCQLWVDAGVSGPAGAERVLAAGAGRVVVGTECLEELSALEAIGEAVSRDKVLVSLDVLGGVVLSKAPGLAGQPPLEGLASLAGQGWSRFILLTLDGVGTGGGPDWGLLEASRRLLPKAVLIAGGGVSAMADVRRATALGLDGALVATALHRGWITARDLRIEQEAEP
jgi:phosphoribosylformimino-5-aminoimidazole carboxamide ribotide isomerase